MKQIGLLFGVLLLFAGSASAQTNSDTTTSTTQLPDSAYASFAWLAPAPIVPASATPSAAVAAEPASPASSSSAAQAPGVQGVFQTYNWQAYFGYTFFRFYVVPHFTNDMNGLNLGIVYYPGGHWVGADGEFVGTFGSAGSQTTKFVMGMGGPRFRWAARDELEVWAHGLVGISNFLPQTAFGKQSAFGYEVGAGVDLNIHHKRIAYRVSGDMIGTHYFNTYQYSPKVSAGIVIKY